jgi:ABC-type transporter Mla MlaB component
VPLQIAEILNLKLTERQLELCIELIETGKVDSAALALLVAELQRSTRPSLMN